MKHEPPKTSHGINVAVNPLNTPVEQYIPDQWINRDEWRLVSGRQRELLKKTGQTDRRTDGWMDGWMVTINRSNVQHVACRPCEARQLILC